MADSSLLLPGGPPCPSGSCSSPYPPLTAGGPNTLRLEDTTLKCLPARLDSLLTSCEFLQGLEGKGCARTPLSPLVARSDVVGIGPKRQASVREGQMSEIVLSQPSRQHREG